MKKYKLLLLLLFLTACSAETPVPTPDPAEVMLTMFANKVNAEATQAAVNSVFTATAQVAAATYTAQAIGTQEAVTQQARIDAQATADQQRADIQATQQRIDAVSTEAQARRDMEATAAQARLDIQTTQQAEVIATAGMMTQMVLPMHNSWTQQAVEQSIIIGTNQVELSNLEVAQQRDTNKLEWAVPFSVALLLSVAAVVFILRYSNAREFKNDDGEIDVIVFGGNKVYKPALAAKPLLLLDSNQMPDLVSPAEQAKVTERAQAVKAISVMPVQTSNNASGAFNKYFSSPQEKPYEIIDGDILPPAGLLDGEALKSIEHDWKEAKRE